MIFLHKDKNLKKDTLGVSRSVFFNRIKQVPCFNCECPLDCSANQFLIHILKSETFHSISKSFSCNAFIFEEKDCFFYNRKDLFFVSEDFIQVSSLRHFLAPASADIDAVAVCVVLDCMERAPAYAAATVVTCIFINSNLSVCQFRHFDRAVIFNLAHLAATAFFQINLPTAILNLCGSFTSR